MRQGEVIAGRFSVERLTAAGGMGEVYRAVDLHTDQLAALKIIRAADAPSIERFTREARVLSELRHPGVVAYLDHGRTGEGLLYLAMEWLEGEDLGKRLATHELDLAESLAVATQAAAALAVAHARRIVHRDVKPSNLFLCDWQAASLKLLDFGVARLGRMSQLTSTGLTIGTPLYMAPEQARGERGVDARADVFALGLVMFRCLTGRTVARGLTPNEVFAWLLGDEPAPRVSSLVPGVPPSLDELVARMLAKEADERPPDGAAVLSEVVGMDVTQRAGPRPAGGLGAEERRVECLVLVDATPGDALRAAAAAHAATVEPGHGGTALVFAGPGLATDLAQQAARCALALRAALPGAALGLAVRRGHHTPTPPALGAAGAILVAPDAAGLLSARFELAGEARGLRLVGEQGLEHPSRPGRATELFGRERELALLDGALAGCVDDGAAAVVLVTAPPGTGKSRLVKEWLARAQAAGADVEVWAGFGDPMRAGAPFGLLGEALRRAAGIRGDEPIERRRALLATRVGRHLAPERAAPATDFLGELAGVPFDAEGNPRLRAARRDALLFGEQVRAAWIDLVAAETAARPLILVLEDLHWGDLATVKLLDDTLRALAERPLLVLALARPEVAELFPRLWEERGLSRIHLAALPRKACERLVRASLGPDAPAEEVAAIVDRGQGNAFFLEELVRHVAERGDRSLPDSVLAMVGARFEAFPAAVRRVVRAASVFGEVFWTAGVAALLDTDAAAVEAALADLVDREVATRRRASRFGDSGELAFRHGLLRDAAYALLTDEDRALGHRLAGGWLAAAGEQEALVLAEHFERGGRPADALGHYRRAAEQALAANDPDGAVACAERGASLGAAAAELGTLRLVQATAHRARGSPHLTRAAGLEAMRLLPRGGEPWFAAAGETAAASGKLSLFAELAEIGLEMERACPPREALSPIHAVALARAANQAYLVSSRELGDGIMAPLLPTPPPQLEGEPEVLAWIDEALCFRGARNGSIHESLLRIQSAARHYAEAGDVRSSLLANLEVSAYLGELGQLRESLAHLEPLVPEVARLRLGGATRLARAYLAMCLVWCDRVDEGLAMAHLSAEGLVAEDNPRVTAAVALGLGLSLEAAGRLAEAELELRRGLEQGAAGMPFVIVLASQLGLLLAASGRAAEALPIVELAASRLASAPAQVYYAPHLVGCRAAALARLGRSDEAQAAARLALDGLHENAAQLPPESRRTFLEAHPGNRRLRDLARELGV